MAGGLQAFSQNSSELLHELIAQFRISIAFFSHVRRAKEIGRDRTDGGSVKFPSIRLKEPRQSQQLAGPKLLNQDCLLIGEFELETDLAFLDQVKSIRGLMLAKDQLS